MNQTVDKLCKNCHKYHNHTILKDCPICNKLEFPENIFCQLTRGGQKGSKLFECVAFSPSLFIVDKNNIKRDVQSSNLIKNEIKEVSISKNVKWFQAYADQQLKIDPDQIFFKLKYHICLCTWKRKRFFYDTNIYIGKISDILKEIGVLFEETIQIYLLWLGVDHIHLYINSAPDYSIDDIVNKTIKNLERDIIKFPKFYNNDDYILERNYYTETIG